MRPSGLRQHAVVTYLTQTEAQLVELARLLDGGHTAQPRSTWLVARAVERLEAHAAAGSIVLCAHRRCRRRSSDHTDRTTPLAAWAGGSVQDDSHARCARTPCSCYRRGRAPPRLQPPQGGRRRGAARAPLLANILSASTRAAPAASRDLERIMPSTW